MNGMIDWPCAPPPVRCGWDKQETRGRRHLQHRSTAITSWYLPFAIFQVTTAKKRNKLRNFDVALNQFSYGDALDHALETRIRQLVAALLEEWGKRRGLTIALSNRDEESLEPVLSFNVRYINRTRFANLVIRLVSKLIDIYGDVAGQSEIIDELFDKLKNHVRGECHTQKALMRLVGQLDAVMTTHELAKLQD